MGDESEQGQDYGGEQYGSDTGAEAQDQGGAQAHDQQPGGDAGQSSVSSAQEALAAAGQAWSNGDYEGSIRYAGMVSQFPDASQDLINRAAYGKVMCYDTLGDFNSAYSTLQSLLNTMNPPNAADYQRQLQGYLANPPRHWQEDYLLV